MFSLFEEPPFLGRSGRMLTRFIVSLSNKSMLQVNGRAVLHSLDNLSLARLICRAKESVALLAQCRYTQIGRYYPRFPRFSAEPPLHLASCSISASWPPCSEELADSDSVEDESCAPRIEFRALILCQLSTLCLEDQ